MGTELGALIMIVGCLITGGTMAVIGYLTLWEAVQRRKRGKRLLELYRQQERYAVKDGFVVYIKPPREMGTTVEIDVGARPIPRNWIFPAHWEDP